MNEKTKALVEHVEHHLRCDAAGCPICFRNGESMFNAPDAMTNLCAIIRAQDARITDLREWLEEEGFVVTDESEEPVVGSFGETVLDAGTIEPSTAPIRKILLG